MTDTQTVKDAIRAIMSELNGGNRQEISLAILTEIQSTHRTLQQDFWSAIIDVLINYGDSSHDLRNEEAVKMAQAFDKLAQAHNWDLGLPRI